MIIKWVRCLTSRPLVFGCLQHSVLAMILATLKASSSAYSGLWFLGVQVKTIMLIQQGEEKENSSSKRYKMSNWSFGDAILMTDWNTVFTATWRRHMALYSIQYWNSGWDDPQTNDELNTFTNFFWPRNQFIIIWLKKYKWKLANNVFLLASDVVCQIGCWLLRLPPFNRFFQKIKVCIYLDV